MQFQIVGFIDDDLLSQGLRVYGARVLGTKADLKKIIEKNDIGLVILADYRMSESDFCSVREIAEGTSARVFVAPDIFGSLAGLKNPSSNEIPIHLDSFQCQHCIARYSHYDPENYYVIPNLTEEQSEF